MKATLEFDCTDGEERQEHLQCVKASDMASFIWELKYNFWRRWKHNDEDLNVDALRGEIQLLLDDHDINPDELYK